MNADIQWFFDKAPKALILYEAVEHKILALWDDITVKVDRTQITFKNKYGFAFVSLPKGKMQNKANAAIIVSFGLAYEVKHPRITVASQPYPDRWTHHVIITAESEIDSELIGWLTEAYNFSKQKARRRKNTP